VQQRLREELGPAIRRGNPLFEGSAFARNLNLRAVSPRVLAEPQLGLGPPPHRSHGVPVLQTRPAPLKFPSSRAFLAAGPAPVVFTASVSSAVVESGIVVYVESAEKRLDRLGLRAGDARLAPFARGNRPPRGFRFRGAARRIRSTRNNSSRGPPGVVHQGRGPGRTGPGRFRAGKPMNSWFANTRNDQAGITRIASKRPAGIRPGPFLPPAAYDAPLVARSSPAALLHEPTAQGRGRDSSGTTVAVPRVARTLGRRPSSARNSPYFTAARAPD